MSNIKIIDQSNEDNNQDSIEVEHSVHDGMMCGLCELYLEMIEKKSHLYEEELVLKLMNDADIIIEHQLLHGVINDVLNEPANRLIPATVAACLLHFNRIHISDGGLSGEDLQLLKDTTHIIAEEMCRIFKKDIEDEANVLRS